MGRGRISPIAAVVGALTALALALALVLGLTSLGPAPDQDGDGLAAETTVTTVPSEQVTGSDSSSTQPSLVEPTPSTTAAATVTVTVEADGAAVDDEDIDLVEPDGGGAGVDGPPPAGPGPTVPPPTDGACRVAMADLAGLAGTFDVVGGGACPALSATIQAVNPRDDLADTDWGRDIRVCQRHPAASGIGVTVASTRGTTTVEDGITRSPDEGSADPIVTIEVAFADQPTPLTGPRPILTCRTSNAELSIVHRPPS